MLPQSESAPPLQLLSVSADKEIMYISQSMISLLTLILLGVLVTLYIMRRRVRLGRRKGTF